ncbi:hypothetical protein MXMO3_00596 [Maritalea myrionectae]|uniref:Class I SAM-dependent methyltransferase n=1 Tax=Maritalea myrionectae TaxID=454601 RepID=A0A2R4MAW3_9HYPH|nr:hypothetical protein [Maritalea myrionectae]AVX03140.1 hypothetical protein MXMO3_00596 [Maritalea myrionectae]
MSALLKPPHFRSVLFHYAAGGLRLPPQLLSPFLFKTGTAPYFDNVSSSAWFLAQLAAAKSYLEYGSGGTTFVAAQLKKPFFSKESDLRFCRSVTQSIAAAGLSAPEQNLVHADIGPTENWGYPGGFRRPNSKRLAQFDAYSDFPEMEVAPDLVLIDGRFRVACFLKAIRALDGARDYTIIVDDYVDRPHYHCIEQFVPKAQMVGRMAVFKPTPITDLDALERQLDAYRYDPR